MRTKFSDLLQAAINKGEDAVAAAYRIEKGEPGLFESHCLADLAIDNPDLEQYLVLHDKFSARYERSESTKAERAQQEQFRQMGLAMLDKALEEKAKPSDPETDYPEYPEQGGK